MVPLKHIQQPPLLSKSSQSSDSQSSSNDKTSSLTSLSSEDDKEEVKEEDYLQINGNRVNVEDYNAQKSCNSRRNSNDNNNNVESMCGKLAVELPPSYLTDTRSVECYHSKNCTDGVLQLR